MLSTVKSEADASDFVTARRHGSWSRTLVKVFQALLPAFLNVRIPRADTLRDLKRVCSCPDAAVNGKRVRTTPVLGQHQHEIRGMRALSAIIATAIVGIVGIQSPPAFAVEGAGSAEPKFIELMNRERTARGLGSLTAAGDLTDYGRNHSGEMAAQNDLHHSTQLRSLTNWKLLGENVGRGGTVQALHDAFMNSPAHRDNVLRSEFSEVGVGVVTSGEVIWVTVVFRQPVTPSAAPAPVNVGGDVVGIAATRSGDGYWVAKVDGSVDRHGDAANLGSGAGRIGAPVVAMAGTPTNNGFWLLDEQGGVHGFGDAAVHGSIPGLRSQGESVGQSRAIAIISTASGNGYWILDAAGGIFTFGDASFRGSVPGLRAAGQPIGNSPMIGMAPTGSGGGYYIVDNVGGVFTFGDASFRGSIPAMREAGTPIGRADVIGMAPTGSGGGYWVLDGVGGVFTFGDAPFVGSVPSLVQEGKAPAGVRGVAVAPVRDGDGYYVLGHTGHVFGFGSAG